MPILLVLALLLAGPAAAQAPLQPEATHARAAEAPSAQATRWMVAAAHPLAAEAGAAVLAEGGTSADAAIAVQAVLGLVEPQSSGLGGGAFALHWDAGTRRLTAWDGRETAPAAATPDYWLSPSGEPLPFWEAVPGGRSVGVPGVPRLLQRLHEAHGRLPWPRLLAPAIEAAERGFPVSPRLAASIAEARGLDRFSAGAYFLPDGQPLAAGETLRNPAYAATLRTLADTPSAFYEGPIAEALLAALDTPSNPSPMTAADLAAYEVRERSPVCLPYRGREVCGMGPPSSGGLTVGQILGISAAFDLPALGDTAQAWRIVTEASKLAFADRNLYMADADFTPMPQGLLNPAYLAARARLIDPDRPMETAAPGEPPWDETQDRAPDLQPERPGTTHFSIVDAEGNAISMTSSIETGFGSRLMAAGFLLNNELTDFSFVPEADGRPRRQPGRGRQAPPLLHGPYGGAGKRRAGPPPRLPRRQPHHRLRRRRAGEDAGFRHDACAGRLRRPHRQPQRPHGD